MDAERFFSDAGTANIHSAAMRHRAFKRFLAADDDVKASMAAAGVQEATLRVQQFGRTTHSARTGITDAPVPQAPVHRASRPRDGF